VKPAAPQEYARLLLPAIRWEPDHGFGHAAGAVAAALEAGVGGFIVFRGPADEVRDLSADLQRRSRHPLLLAADLERGAGQQFAGATQLPPAGSLGFIDDLEVTRAAGALTAREARAVGINWVFAPVADLDVEPLNPIVGTRAFGGDPRLAARHVAAWIEGCRAEGVLCCAKHFPGHGRTRTDSHIELPEVAADRQALEQDLAPFRAAVAARVDSVMTAHVRFAALDPQQPATLSGPVLTTLLRGDVGHDGVVVSDSLSMAGVRVGGCSEAETAVAALRAGCDALLGVEDPAGVAAAIAAAVEAGRLGRDRVADARRRFARALAGAHLQPEGSWGLADDRAWAAETARRGLFAPPPHRDWPTVLDLVVIDDDRGGRHPPPDRSVLGERLRGHGLDVREVTEPGGDRAVVAALFSDVRAEKGRAGAAADVRARLGAPGVAAAAHVVVFSHPRTAELAGLGFDLCAWGGEVVMQRAAADWIARRALH
jgi:beta-glucosidase-like glycosyl hydrolase